ncbi:MAG: HAD family hydrolase [Bacteroidales bacterium]|jgi:phosphoglycolate phosphatase|nr:HAD family hydrolase [Bacteroidales bacterium]
MVEGIIFDLDGTLVHTIEDIGDAANTLFRRHGYPEYTTSDFIQWIGSGAAKFIEHGIGSVIDKDHLKDYVSEFKEIYSNSLTVKSKLYEGTAEMLDELIDRKIKIAILSNKPHILTLGVAENLLSSWDFEVVFGQRDEVPRKPDPAAAIEIAALLNISPEKTLFVGDSEGDINTSVAAGMIPVGVSWGYGNMDIASENGYSIINHPSELLELVKKL